jgi:hypothetical protein
MLNTNYDTDERRVSNQVADGANCRISAPLRRHEALWIQ